jgi:hypothetical protein
VRGTLSKYVSKTGEIEIRWRDPAQTDLERDEDGDLWFPAPFCGPFTVVVRGDAYPTTTDTTPTVVVGMVEDPKTGRRHSFRANPASRSTTRDTSTCGCRRA